jgi:hypothetical protein
VQRADFLDFSCDKEAYAKHNMVNISCQQNFVSQILSINYTDVGWGTGIAEANISCSYFYFAGNKHADTGV